jgi:putative SOS response-associated peptidase YedK
MCGKFTQISGWSEVVDYADLIPTRPADRTRTFTPMNGVPVVHLDAEGERVVHPMVWGYTNRVATGHRIPRHMHARGETVDRTFATAFRFRRGIVFAQTFNVGEEVRVTYSDGAPSGRIWTRQWTVRPKDGQPLCMAVIYDIFDCGRGPEREFVQVTTAANPLISRITDRMPLILRPEDIPLWLGEVRAPIIDVKALIRVFDDEGAWEMTPEDPGKRPPRPRNPEPGPSSQGELF